MKTRWNVVNVVLAALVTTAAGGAGIGCTNDATPSGSVEVVASSAQALSSVAYVTVTVSGDGIAAPIQQTLTASHGRYAGTVADIPPSTNVVVQGAAYDASGNETYEGTISGVSITSAEPTLVALVLQTTIPPAPFVGEAPVINGIVASTTTPTPGSTVSLSISTFDANADIVTYAWSATDGSFDDPSSASPVWTAPPTPETVTLKVTIADALGGAATTTFPLTVTADGSLEVTATFDSWPTVTAMSANPTRIVAGSSTALTVTACDVDGDALSYSWSADCDGTFDDASAAAPIFTLSALPASSECTFTVTVSDGEGGETVGQYGIEAAAAPTVTTEEGRSLAVSASRD
jgi:hypothetical protein